MPSIVHHPRRPCPTSTTGRGMCALRLCLEAADSLGQEALSALLDRALAHDRGTVAMERAWTRAKQQTRARGRALSVHRQIARLIGIIHRNLTDNINGLDVEDPAARASMILLEQLFPQGVKPVVSLPFEDQLAMNDAILARLKGDLTKAAESAAVGRFATRLQALNDTFRDELTKSGAKEIDYKELAAARDRGNLNLRHYAAAVIAAYPPESGDGQQEALLRPILEQSERTRQLRRDRRPPRDIDPETGEETGESAGAADE